MPTFSDIVDKATSLDIDEMQQLKEIISKVIIEKRREEILKNHEESKELYAAGKLKFYDNATELLNALNIE